ncbi:MAG: hypothetical protein G8D89_22330 [gamma proteobacterium symbiont of Clathrolucina costata]
MRKMMVIDDPLMTEDEAAEYLGIPNIALGQAVADNKLTLGPGFSYYRQQVVALKASDKDYIALLK